MRTVSKGGAKKKWCSIGKRIDGDEIQEEMDIISNYMSNVEKYYETRKKRFKIFNSKAVD